MLLRTGKMISRRSHLSKSETPFPNIDFLESLRPTRMELGLRNISRVLNLLGNPQRKFPAVHVGGTNGKGSVTTFLSSILSRSGLRVGSFYSPHLFRINERIRINGDEIPSAVLNGILGKLKGLYPEAPFTYFEGITAAAILYFLNDVDIAVFEVGLGGRLDATRLVNSVVSVITGISRDHIKHLGETRREILGEKLGIVKEGVPTLVNLDDEKLAEAARKYSREKGSPFYNARDEADVIIEGIGKEYMSISVKTDRRNYGRVRTTMLGEHQSKNIATSVRVVELLESMMLYQMGQDNGDSGVRMAVRARSVLKTGSGRWYAFGTDIKRWVREGLEHAVLAGRFQIISIAPNVIFDVAHNEEAMIASLHNLCRISRPERNVIIFSYLSRKEPGSFPKEAIGAARRIIVAPLRSRQGVGVETLRNIFEPYASPDLVETAENIEDAVIRAMKIITREDTLLILGSHITVEEAAAFF
jgi:dihydrofolate synthase/folylpolyglutamate synthase